MCNIFFWFQPTTYLQDGERSRTSSKQGKAATTPSTTPSCIATKAATKAYSTYAKKSCRPAAAASPVPAATFPTKYYTPTTTSICPPATTNRLTLIISLQTPSQKSGQEKMWQNLFHLFRINLLKAFGFWQDGGLLIFIIILSLSSCSINCLSFIEDKVRLFSSLPIST